jgi:hypothetical protein
MPGGRSTDGDVSLNGIVAERIWFGGLPVTGRRDLMVDEIAFVRRQLQMMVLSMALNIAMLGAILVFVFILVDVSFMIGWYGFIVLAAMRGAFTLLQHRRWYPWRSISRIEHDLDSGIVFVCEGTPEEATIAAHSDTLRIDVLPQSGLIVRWNGATLGEPRFAPCSTTAAPPPHAEMAANFVRPLDEVENVFAHRRALSANEMTELDRYAPPVHVVDAALALVAFTSAALSYVLAMQGKITTLFPSAGFLVIGSYTASRTWQSWRARRFIAGDLDSAYVVILRVRDTDGQLSEPEEYLPVSRMLWTAGGAPARWRKQLSPSGHNSGR